MSSTTAFRQGIYQFDWARRIVRWLDAMPNAALALEVAPDRVAAARWSRTGSLDGYAVESLPDGALVPSAVEANIVNAAAVKAADAVGVVMHHVLLRCSAVLERNADVITSRLPVDRVAHRQNIAADVDPL